MNVPIVCSDGGSGCSLEFQLYDETDKYTCEDSTLAVIVCHLKDFLFKTYMKYLLMFPGSWYVDKTRFDRNSIKTTKKNS